jgi:hypothetical protein
VDLVAPKWCSSSLGRATLWGRRREVFIPPPQNLTVASQESPAKARVKSGYSQSHRLKPASTPAIAVLKNPALSEIAGRMFGLQQRGIALSKSG